MTLFNKLITGFFATSIAFFSAVSAAQTWPDRPIRLIVPFAPGGGTDIFARAMAPKLSEALGQQIVIENKPGGSSIIGSQQVAQSTPNGYTLLVVDSSFMINPGLRKDLPYNSETDFVPIVHLASGPVILVVNPKVQANSVKDLIATAKKRSWFLVLWLRW